MVEVGSRAQVLQDRWAEWGSELNNRQLRRADENNNGVVSLNEITDFKNAQTGNYKGHVATNIVPRANAETDPLNKLGTLSPAAQQTYAELVQADDAGMLENTDGIGDPAQFYSFVSPVSGSTVTVDTRDASDSEYLGAGGLSYDTKYSFSDGREIVVHQVASEGSYVLNAKHNQIAGVTSNH